MLRDHHVVGPEHAALIRHHELEVGVVGQQLHHVARPHHRSREVAVGQMVRVVVAVEGADLLVVDVGLDRVVGLLRVGGGARGWIDSQVQHHQAERVAHLGQEADLALELGIPQVADGGQVTAGQLAVVADAGETGLPGHEELVVGVDRAAVVGGQQVRLDVGQDVPLERLDVAELHPLAGHPVGQRDQVAADVLAGLQRRLELPEELLVVVDVLDVVGVGLVLGVEHIDRGVAVVLLVDVERPVRPVPVRGDRVRVLDRSAGGAQVLGAGATHRTAAGGQQVGGGQRASGKADTAHEVAAGKGATGEGQGLDVGARASGLGGHICSSRVGTSRVSVMTKVCSGSHSTPTFWPGATRSALRPTFCANTVSSSPAAVSMMYWVLTPM